MVDGLVGDALDAPDAGREKWRFGREMDRNFRQIAAQRVFDREVADDRHGVLIERDVDVVRGGAGDFYPCSRIIQSISLQHTLPPNRTCGVHR